MRVASLNGAIEAVLVASDKFEEDGGFDPESRDRLIEAIELLRNSYVNEEGMSDLYKVLTDRL